MKLLQKRWVAITLCVLMIVSALAIGQAKKNSTEYAPGSSVSSENWAEDHYSSYTRYVRDDAGMLSDNTIEKVSAFNAASDYSYGAICGLWTAEDLSSQDLEEVAFQYAEELGLGESDYFLLLDEENSDWYFAYGDSASHYVDNQLEILVTGVVSHVFSDPDDQILNLYEELSHWYSEKLPLADDGYDGVNTVSVVGGSAFFVGLIVLLVILAVFSSLFRAGRRVVGGWFPVFFPGRRWNRTTFHAGPRPGPGPGPNVRNHSGSRPGPASRPNPSSRAGGFGGGNRGNFGRGGGFGGGSRGGGRGGGFGGKR